MLVGRRVTSICRGSRMMSSIDFAKHREEFDKDGFTIVRGVFDKEFVAHMGEHVKWLQKKFPTIPGEHLHHPIMRNDPFWVSVCADEKLMRAAQEIVPSVLGDGLALFSSHYFRKEALSGKPVYWHTDAVYWPLEPMDVATAWVCVDGSNRENGCLKVLRGSHLEEARELRKDGTADNVLGSRTHDDEEIDEDRVVYLELEPGDVSFHDPRIVHASDANTSPHPRTGLTVRYMSPSTHCLSDEQPVLLLQGEASGKGRENKWRSWPKFRSGYDFDFPGSEEWNARRRIVPEDESFFETTDYEALDRRIEQEVQDVILSLQ